MLPTILAVEDAVQVLKDAVAAGGTTGYVLGGIALVVLIIPIVLKALGKSVPVLDPILDVVLSVAQKLLTKKPAPAVEPEKKGVEAVVEVKKE